MTFEIALILGCVAISIILFFFLFGIIGYDQKNKRRTLTKKDENDWLFSESQESIFKLFYGKSDEETILGINKSDFNRYCKLLHENHSYENFVTRRIIGGIILLVGIALYFNFYLNGQLIYGALFGLAGFGAFYLLWIIPYGQLKNKAEDRILRIQDDFPRFLALLDKALDLPIDQAMLLTAQKFPSPMSEDIIDSINKVSLGADGWNVTLVELAKVYDIEVFSDFVLEIVNAYEQGVDIRKLIERKVSDVEQSRMFAVEAHDAKIKSMIFIPVIIFKVIPLMVLILLPMAGDLL